MPHDEAKLRSVRLRAARDLKGLGQQKAADLIGVSRTTLSGYENGEPIDERHVGSIVRVYGGTKGWVRYGEGKGPPGYNAAEVPVALETIEEGTQPVEVPAPRKKARRKKRVQGSRSR